MAKNNDFTQEEWESCLKVLQALCKDPELAPDISAIKGLVTKLYKSARKTRRKRIREEQHLYDKALLENTVLCHQQPAPNLPQLPAVDPKKKLHSARHCYVCKKPYTTVHFFYHMLCPVCAKLNYEKRSQTVDLSGRIALVTGGRIKIGYEMVLKLLRDGAKVIATTRFPHNCIHRYSQETDFNAWSERLEIYGLDLRNIPQVNAFIQHLVQTQPQLDILIHNAAQTIKHPPAFYAHLIEAEKTPRQELPDSLQCVLKDFANSSPSHLMDSINCTSLPLSKGNKHFPVGQYDQDGQQIDLREKNSWVESIEEVGAIEWLEVHLINGLAPFLLSGHLKPLLLNTSFDKRFIINVSAMEGKFNRNYKSIYHPHTNMAKAGLNMMTRTSAAGYAEDCIYMNSVDTGWITDENPHPKKMAERERGFVPPLDCIDGAARVYDPVVMGIKNSPTYGKFYKDYSETQW